MRALFEALYRAMQRGEDAVLCSVAAAHGSAPRGSGAKMAVFSDGTQTGSVGGGALEHQCAQRARAMLQNKARQSVGMERFSLTPGEAGMVCGGVVEVLLQRFSAQSERDCALLHEAFVLAGRDADGWLITALPENAPPQSCLYEMGGGLRLGEGFDEAAVLPLLKSHPVYNAQARLYAEPLAVAGTVYVFGGGHISLETVPLLTHLGFRTAVYEDRAEFAAKERFPAAAARIVAPFEELENELRLTSRDAAVILTRGHMGDLAVLSRVLGAPLWYIGMIGSKNKIAACFELLKQAGWTQEDLARVHAPIGVPLGGNSPAEIAVSIAAELIRCRAERDGEGR